MKKLSLILLTAVACLIGSPSAWAIPSFARMYNYNCTMCHYPGYGQLNKFGYNFRAAGYRIPSDIGKEMNGGKVDWTNYIAARFSAGVKASTQTNANGSATPDNGSFTLGGSSIFLGGGLSKNFFAYSELGLGNGTGVFPGSSPSLSDAKLGYVTGSENDFFTVRIGKFGADGYAGSDRGPVGNATIAGTVRPTGTGLELGYTHDDTRVTLAFYDGIQAPVYSGLDTSSLGATTAQTAPTSDSNNAKDIQIFVNQFIGDDGAAINATYYNGFNGSVAAPGSPIPSVANGAGTGDSTGQEYYYGALFANAPLPLKNLDIKAGAEIGQTNAGIFGVAGVNNPASGGFFGELDYALDDLTPVAIRWDSTSTNISASNVDTEKITFGALTPFVQNIYLNPQYALIMTNSAAGYTYAHALSSSLNLFF